MRFQYKPIQTTAPVVSLNGRQDRPRPIAPITLIGPTNSKLTVGHVDSFSDDTVFPEQYAIYCGIDLTNAPRGTAAGIGQNPVPVKYAQVTLRMADRTEQREWTGWVGFSPVLHNYALLGFAGCLQYFTTTFYGDLEEVELIVNSLYPGT
jgi:hypothetical protein